MRPDEFEEQVRRSVGRREELRPRSPADDRRRQGRRRRVQKRNERVKVQSSASSRTSSATGVTATDAEVAKQFEDHKESYRNGEKRKVRYVTVDQEGLRARSATVTGQAAIERSYNDNIQHTRRPSRCAPATSSSRPRGRTMRR
jgi:hypothetical protein